MFFPSIFHSPVYELIDTLWNVNVKMVRKPSVCQSGINRYIMECKCIFVPAYCGLTLELIDTLWNVNEPVCPTMIA